MALFENLSAGKFVYDSLDSTRVSSTVAAAKVDYAAGGLDTEAVIIAAVNATNGKINSLITALEKAKILV